MWHAVQNLSAGTNIYNIFCTTTMWLSGHQKIPFQCLKSFDSRGLARERRYDCIVTFTEGAAVFSNVQAKSSCPSCKISAAHSFDPMCSYLR